MFRTALVAAAVIPFWAAPAQAQSLPTEPAQVFLKDHEDLPLAWTDAGARLSADYDEWTFRSVEALLDLGGYQIRHEDTGQCLTTDTAGGGAAFPVTLADCAEALAWQVEFHDIPSHEDFRFITPDGYYLGLEDGDEVVEGAEVLAVDLDTGVTKHFQEWRLEVLGAPPSESPSPSGSPSPSADVSVSPAVQAQLPATGGGLGAAIGGGAVAVAGGAALVLWWQRRRALRSHW
jgi:hypothetical protein